MLCFHLDERKHFTTVISLTYYNSLVNKRASNAGFYKYSFIYLVCFTYDLVEQLIKTRLLLVKFKLGIINKNTYRVIRTRST